MINSCVYNSQQAHAMILSVGQGANTALEDAGTWVGVLITPTAFTFIDRSTSIYTPQHPFRPSFIHPHTRYTHPQNTVYIASYLRDALRLFPSPTGKGQAIEAAFRAFQDVRVPHCTAIQARFIV